MMSKRMARRCAMCADCSPRRCQLRRRGRRRRRRCQELGFPVVVLSPPQLRVLQVVKVDFRPLGLEAGTGAEEGVSEEDRARRRRQQQRHRQQQAHLQEGPAAPILVRRQGVHIGLCHAPLQRCRVLQCAGQHWRVFGAMCMPCSLTKHYRESQMGTNRSTHRHRCDVIAAAARREVRSDEALRLLRVGIPPVIAVEAGVSKQQRAGGRARRPAG